ncbi:MAG TPA: RNA methyltransferase [Gammaproteobacteria bacterium]|nr:RNA methyltransferase [Gammaproteobacteria bacterium]
MKVLREALAAAGARPRHETLALRAWCRGLPLDAFAKREDAAFPKRLRDELPALQRLFDSLVTVCAEHAGADGSARLLLALGDGQTIESVHLPGDGVCVSTQVGCAVGCTFCMTGRDGLRRQLGSAEIVAQVALARARRATRRVVLMGMGEPAHNLDNVLEALDLLGSEGDLNTKNLVLSTVGDRRVFERLPHERIKPALALSLHTTKPELRAELLPRAPRIEPAELVELADEYSRATKYPTQYQWTLLEGVNDGDDELEGIARLLAGKYAVMNFIPYNTVEGAAYRRPSWRRAAEMTRYLYHRGVLAKVRRSAGQDVEAGCGQLRRRHAAAPAAAAASAREA